MRLGPPPEADGGARAVLEGLHPRDRAGLPQADDRAARGRSSRRRSRRWSTARATSTTGCARSSTRSQPDVIVEDNVVLLPRAAGLRAAVGADRLLQPGRDQGPRRAAAVLRLPGRRPLAAGTRTGPSTARAHGELHAAFDAFCVERGAPPLPELEFIHDVAVT